MSGLWPDNATAGARYVVLIRTANALAALRCYWSSTHHMDVIAGVWLACRRDGRGLVVAADCPAELHRQLAHQSGSWPSLVHPQRGPRLNDPHARCRAATPLRVRCGR
jgi:hypothetical protein